MERFRLPFAEDKSNSDERFSRNLLRSRVMPALADIVPNAAEHIAAFAVRASEDDAYLRSLACAALTERGGAVCVPVGLPAPVFSRACLAALAACGVERDYTSANLAEIARLTVLQSGRKATLPEGVTAVRVDSFAEAKEAFSRHQIAVMVDPEAMLLKTERFDAVVDAIIAKRNLGTRIDMAPVVIGVGPGFEAGKDCHYVVETKRGHHLGRIYTSGCAIPNTGIPGDIQGFSIQRVVHSPYAGEMRCLHQIGDIVKEGEPLALVGGQPVKATMDGLLRGILPDGYPVTVKLKMADIDPRTDQVKNCDTISDKARCIAGGVLEAILRGYPV